MCDKKNNAATRLAGAAILVMAVTSLPVLAQTPPASTEQVELKITNTGNEELILGTPEWPKGFVRGTPVPGECGKVIPVGGHCKWSIRFVPTTVGKYSGELIIPMNNGNARSVVVKLNGTGLAK